MQNNKIPRVCGGGALKNNNFSNSQNYGSLSFLKTSKIIKNHKIINFLAFSLIELSIVLIIIGLLVAGVTGGKSLIESTKIRAFANEMLSYKQAFATFYVTKGRLPGDLNGDGYIGSEYNGSGCTAETYSTTSFQVPYNVVAPTKDSGPFIDLYLEGLNDFKPDPEYPNSTPGKGVPYSKVYKDGHFNFTSTCNNHSSSDYIKNSKNGTIYLRNYNGKSITSKIAKIIDVKIDDGIWDSGDFRGSCSTSISYEDAIDKNYKCSYTRYKVNMI